MNREKRDKIPSMQVSFIDAICTQLYQVLGDQRPVQNLWAEPSLLDSVELWRSSRFSRFSPSLCPVADVGWHVGGLLPAPGGLPEEPAAVEASGRRV